LDRRGSRLFGGETPLFLGCRGGAHPVLGVQWGRWGIPHVFCRAGGRGGHPAFGVCRGARPFLVGEWGNPGFFGVQQHSALFWCAEGGILHVLVCNGGPRFLVCSGGTARFFGVQQGAHRAVLVCSGGTRFFGVHRGALRAFWCAMGGQSPPFCCAEGGTPWVFAVQWEMHTRFFGVQ